MTTTDSLKEFLESQFQVWNLQDVAHKRGRTGPVISITREPGCGGEHIAKTIAQALGLMLYDGQLVEAIAKDAHVSARVVATLDEKVRSQLDDWLSSFSAGSISADQYMQSLRSVLFTLAAHGNAVIVGRGANFVLPADRKTLGLCLVAPLELRVNNMMKELRLSSDGARQHIAYLERERRQWVKQIGFADIDDVTNYHLVINTALVPTETIVQIVKDFITESPAKEAQ